MLPFQTMISGVYRMIRLIKLSRNDGMDIFEMLKGIGKEENSFTNPTYEMTFSEFKEWLNQQEQWDTGENLPKGYVAQSIYWMYDDSNPVGIGKIRHDLTVDSRKNGGNIGYAISKLFKSVLPVLIRTAAGQHNKNSQYARW